MEFIPLPAGSVCDADAYTGVALYSGLGALWIAIGPRGWANGYSPSLTDAESSARDRISKWQAEDQHLSDGETSRSTKLGQLRSLQDDLIGCLTVPRSKFDLLLAQAISVVYGDRNQAAAKLETSSSRIQRWINGAVPLNHVKISRLILADTREAMIKALVDSLPTKRPRPAPTGYNCKHGNYHAPLKATDGNWHFIACRQCVKED